jgi:hypothetical protein
MTNKPERMPSSFGISPAVGRKYLIQRQRVGRSLTAWEGANVWSPDHFYCGQIDGHRTTAEGRRIKGIGPESSPRQRDIEGTMTDRRDQ